MATNPAVDLHESALIGRDDHDASETAATPADPGPRNKKTSHRTNRRKQVRKAPIKTQQRLSGQTDHNVSLLKSRQENRTISPSTLPPIASTTLANQLVFTIESLQLRSSWVPLLVSQIGLNVSLDAAIQTICHAAHWHALKLNGYNNAVIKHKALAQNVRTLRALQDLIRSPDRLSDYALGTICLLEWYEILVPENAVGPSAVVKHMAAFRALLLARPKAEAPTPLARAIVHTSVPFHFNFSTDVPGHAIHSLFENDERWLEPTAHMTDTLPVYLLQLRRSALAIYMRLPRLISDVAALRRGEDMDIIATQFRATALLAYEATECENLLLHNVTVRKSTAEDELTRKVAPYCFKFPSQHYLLGSIEYWQTRMMVLQISLGLNELSPTPWLSAEQTDHFVAELDRMTRNAVMSWEYIHSDYMPGRMQYLPLLKVVWASLSRLEERQANNVREWITRRRLEAGIRAESQPQPTGAEAGAEARQTTVSSHDESGQDPEPTMMTFARDWHHYVHRDSPEASDALGQFVEDGTG